ncbi:hypothetical protein [Actinomadura sp. 3N508]|uniref:hypothetical protein n=1 Tax=Actinomadura sp. 3N508 TaxID=3375153 RepID=UPI00378AE9BE
MTLPVLLLLWSSVHWARPWTHFAPDWQGLVGALGIAATVINLAAIAGVWHARYATGRRRHSRPGRERARLGGFVLTVLAAYGITVLTIMSITALVSWRLLLTPAVSLATALSVALGLLLARSARRCLPSGDGPASAR